MLPKENRLTKKAEFAEVLKKGRVLQGPLFGLAVFERGGDLPAKAGIIISKKVSKLATKRNRSKRILRECLRRLIKGVRLGTLMVVLAKKGITGAKKEEVKKELERRLTILANR